MLIIELVGFYVEFILIYLLICDSLGCYSDRWKWHNNKSKVQLPNP